MTYIDKIVGKLWLDRTILYATMSQLPALGSKHVPTSLSFQKKHLSLPVGRGGAVNVIIPVADSKLLVEAGLISAHVGNPPAVLVTHVEYLAIWNSQYWSPSAL